MAVYERFDLFLGREEREKLTTLTFLRKAEATRSVITCLGVSIFATIGLVGASGVVFSGCFFFFLHVFAFWGDWEKRSGRSRFLCANLLTTFLFASLFMIRWPLN